MADPTTGGERRVYMCDRCNGECGAGVADLGDTACSVCGQHDAPHVYVPAQELERLGQIAQKWIERAREAQWDNKRLREALERILERLDPTRTANPLHKASEVVSIARAALDRERSLEARE